MAVLYCARFDYSSPPLSGWLKSTLNCSRIDHGMSMGCPGGRDSLCRSSLAYAMIQIDGRGSTELAWRQPDFCWRLRHMTWAAIEAKYTMATEVHVMHTFVPCKHACLNVPFSVVEANLPKLAAMST
jgi:hypothetical protein